MQFLADNSDHEKRTRARYGLDMIKSLQDLNTVEVEIYADYAEGQPLLLGETTV